MDGAMLPTALWCAAAAAGVVYVALFLLARRPVSMRAGRVGGAAVVVLALRLALLAAGYPLAAAWVGVALGAAALVAVSALALGRGAWLVRAAAEEFGEQVRAGCRGLFLPCKEALPGFFRLTAKEGTWPLRLRRVNDRIQLVIVPRPVGGGKAALFVRWLSRQYPGPVPRLRITLTRSDP